MWRAWVLACLFSGCGSNHNIPTDGSTNQPPIDGPTDGPPDAPSASSALVINDGVGTITAWTAPSAYATTASSGRLFVYNTGSASSAGVVPAITGADAASFSIDGANTTCGMPLAGLDGCWLQIAFSPITAGTKTATLAVGGGGDPVTVALTGLALPGPTTGLTADVAELDFGLMNKSDTKQLHVLLENVGTTTVTLGTRTATSPFQYASDNCAATITPGGACTINITFTSASLGHFTGTLDIASDANVLHLPLDATNLRLIQISSIGDGTGSVTSLPSGISCPGTCAAGFPGGVPVTLTAGVDASNVFAHWAGICSGTASTCSIPSPVDGFAVPRFSLASDKQIHIAFAGSGPSYVGVENTPSLIDTCSSDCTIYVASGTQVLLRGFSASTFGGWSGDCVASTSDCSLGTVINDRSVTITSNPDPYEAATLSPSKQVKGLAVTSTGDLIVGSPVDVSKVSITGTVAWSTAITGGVRGLAIDAADEVFAIGTNSIIKLSATGTVMWSQTLTANVLGYANNPAIAVAPDGTTIAVLTNTGMRVLDGSGGDRFAITNAPNATSVAVAPDGTIALGEDDVAIGDVVQAARYSSGGTSLTSFGPLAGTLHAALLFTSTNTLCAATHGENSITASLVNTAGTTVYSQSESKPLLTGPWSSGVIATPTGECGKISLLSQLTFNPGVKLDVYSATGTVVHSITKQPVVGDGSFNGIGVYATWIASGGTNRVAIAGGFVSKPWIQVLDLP
jgi:trimeric autotransporter adhesin